MTGESGQILSFSSAEEVHSKEIGQEQYNVREDESRDDIVTTFYRGMFDGCGFYCGVDRGGRPKVDLGNKLCVGVCVCVCVWVCVCVCVCGWVWLFITIANADWGLASIPGRVFAFITIRRT